MAMHVEHDYYAARESEESAARLARRSRREDRRRTDWRRARALAITALALGFVLTVGGFTAMASTRGITDVERSAPVVSRRNVASPQAPAAREATVSATVASAASGPTQQTRAGTRRASRTRERVSARPASESKRRDRRKVAETAGGPPAKTAARPRPTSILVRKCSAGCHATSALLTLRFDSASAAIVADGMVEAQGVRLTKQERAAVIAALSRK